MNVTIRNNWSLIPKSRYEANERERIRTHSVNSAFITLRNLIPTEPRDRKLSKIEILRLACSYISHLSSVLVAENCQKLEETSVFANDFSYTRRPQICTFCMTSLHSNYID